jgi:hypothetical protein
MADFFCGVDDSVFTQKECSVDLGGIILVAFIDKDTPSPSEANLDDSTWWSDKLATSPPTLFYVGETRGEYNGGTVVEGDGWGKTGNQPLGYEHELTFEVENIQANRAFWEDKMRRKYKFAFMTAGRDLYYVDTPVVVHATPTVPRDVIEGTFWSVTIKWES